MKRLRRSGLLGLAWGLLLALCVSGALARQVPPLAATGAPLTLGDRGDYWIDAGGRASLAEVLALPASAFAPTRADRYYPLRDGQALWIRFEVAPTPGSLRWYLALPDTRLDRATLYTPGPAGWTEQTAGDHIAVSQWPLPHAHPALGLALSATGATPFVLRIAGSEGFWTAPHFETERRQDATQQRASLIAGMYFGLLSMAVVFGLICAAVFRDRAYLWFSLFAMGINLVVARTVGIAGLHFWPDSPRWNNAAEHVLSITSMAPLLAFVAVALSLRNRKLSLYFSVCALALLALLGAALAWLMPPGGRLALTILFVLGLSLTGLAITGWAWWRGDRFARWILLAFTPMLAALPFPVGRWLQWLPQSFLTQHAIQLSLMLTVPAVLLLLIIRSQERLDYRRRITRLDHVDPLTGLLNDEVFGHRMRGMIERSRRLDCESAVMLVDFTNLEDVGREFGRKAALEVMLRLAGRLTVMARPLDTVARVGEARYGVLIEGPVPPDRAAPLASKFLARLILPFAGLPRGLTVRAKVAVALVPSQAATVEEALAALDVLLLGAHPQESKSIFTMEPVSELSLPA